MAAPFFSTPFQPFVYQSPQDAVTPFQILGGEAQIVQIMLKPQEKVIAKPVHLFNLFFIQVSVGQRPFSNNNTIGCFYMQSGSMCYMSGSIQMDNVYVPENEAGVWQWLFGKSVTSIVLHNTGSMMGFLPIFPFEYLVQIDLALFGGEMLCQPDAFLCSINDVKVNNTVDPRVRNVLTSAEGFLRQKISGQGLAFIVGGGSVVQKNLEVGEVLAVDVSSIVAVSSSVNVQIKYNGPMRRVVFGGDNLATAVITGPGIVFIQSMPFNRLSQRIARAVTSPNVRDNPKFFFQIAIFFFLAYVVVVSSLILTDI
ncbi:tryptophan RNA-binding attenuator protein-like [Striga asiatica]|uniref:Tryptophan RNA-binding attenuator protein-like n=1 Tax=Striga asiatica TaxID=4170 RepID=A0A5A7PQ53_STRAF|nr:tryptophan RNA-binding attenuator protein-like [Striga asiatica]